MTQPPPYDVRLAAPGEEDQVCAVCTEGFTESSRGLLPPATIRRQVATFYNRDRVRQEIVTAGSTPAWLGYVVAVTTDGQVLGAAGGGIRDDGAGQVYVLYLRMHLRRAGIGSALLAYVTDQHKRLGASEQWVSVTEGNELGIPFYRARGFVERDRQPFAVDGDGAVEAYSLRMCRAV
jgi:ribosomal protein S18 acetylase RimI-like enzyme